MSEQPSSGPVQTTEGYGLNGPADGSALAWAEVEGWLKSSRNYWVGTTRVDGRPHAMPVWGFWAEGAVWFSTDPSSIKGRNLIERPEVVVHLESGDEVCILTGRAERVTDRGVLATFDDRYHEKYDVRPSDMGDSAGVFVLRPTTALVWKESEYATSATRFTF